MDRLVNEIITMHPNCGEKSITGRLRSLGYHIQRERVRSSLRRIDPSGVERQVRRVLHRRTYYVKAPNALWHLDGYHKFIRWRFVIHGGIDGFSRLITFLRVSGNNRAETVFSAFCGAIAEYGLPSRVRTDRGGSIITGRSVHNQRIERLWRDLFSGCICYFYHLFYFMEGEGILDQQLLYYETNTLCTQYNKDNFIL